MKILILDVDGVLNDNNTKVRFTEHGVKFIGVDKSKLVLLNKIVKATNAKIVMSSTWRIHPVAMKYLRNKMKKVDENLGNSIIGYTPFLNDEPRSVEIDTWLIENQDQVDRYVIIDDYDEGLSTTFGSRFVQTYVLGLTEADVEKCINLLGKE